MSTPSSPRPILKKRASSRYLSVCGSLDKDLSLLRKTVQFSPERDYQIFQAHSPDVYDRSPLKVPANHCELPERGYKGSPSRGRERRLASSGSERLFPSSPERAMSMHELVKALPALDGKPATRGAAASRGQAVAAPKGPHALDGSPLRLRVETRLVDPLAPSPAAPAKPSVR